MKEMLHPTESPADESKKGSDAGKNQVRRGKAFTRIELVLLVLHLIRLNPTHGYEVITSIRDYSQGVYRPSPGVIYPILTSIEEEKYATTIESGGGKKQYSLTAAGEAYLAQHHEALRDTLIKMKKLVVSQTQKDPLIEEAFEKLKFSLRTLTTNRTVNENERAAIVSAIIEASEKIRRI